MHGVLNLIRLSFRIWKWPFERASTTDMYKKTTFTKSQIYLANIITCWHHGKKKEE